MHYPAGGGVRVASFAFKETVPKQVALNHASQKQALIRLVLLFTQRFYAS